MPAHLGGATLARRPPCLIHLSSAKLEFEIPLKPHCAPPSALGSFGCCSADVRPVVDFTKSRPLRAGRNANNKHTTAEGRHDARLNHRMGRRTRHSRRDPKKLANGCEAAHAPHPKPYDTLPLQKAVLLACGILAPHCLLQRSKLFG